MLSSKKSTLISWLILAVLALSAFKTADAASLSFGTITTTAEIPNALALNITITDLSTGQEIPSMDFGVVDNSAGQLHSNRLFRVLLAVNAQGVSYEIKHDVSPLVRSGGSEVIPSGAFSARPFYVAEDNAGQLIPSGSRLAVTGPAEALKTIFTDPSGSSRVISMIYALSGDPSTGATEKIPVSQRSGSYSGTIQFTLTTS